MRLFKQDLATEGNVLSMSMRNTISTEKEIQLFRRRADKDVRSDKSDNERTPLVNAVASISNIKYVNWAAIQNMINGFEAGV